MKIADVKTFVVGNPPPHFGGRYWVFIKLTTDTGIDGIGEAYSDATDKTDVYQDQDLAAERAAEYVQQGFTAVKFDPVGPYSAFDPRQLSLEALEHTENFVKKVREAVGGKCDLLFGTHGQMTASSAIRLAKRLEKFDPLWFEEPVPPENMQEMARVARSTSIPIATGERLAGKYEFAQLLGHQAASIPTTGKHFISKC
jgi:2-dehydro-3-deoxyphosphogalactonate aldolase